MHHPRLSGFRRQLTAAFLAVALIFPAIRPAHALEKATVQLKWLHHFQFAGYYAAVEKGFYREAGLDVTIVEGGPTAEVEKNVASGRADFGVGTSALLLNRNMGQDFVVLGQVFQHSPAIFLTPRKTGIRSVADMSGRRFMYSNQHGDMLALLKKFGIDEGQITKVPHNGDPRDLINGTADVMLAYSFNEPFIMEQAGEPYLAFSPLTSGIDFYGDNFFTTRRLIDDRPDFVESFRQATLHGWRYALDNKGEIADLILARYSTGKSREWLLFEADQMESLIQPNMVELGYQSQSRWQRISDTFSDLGMLPKGFDPTPILYVPKTNGDYSLLIAVSLLSASIIGFLVWLVLTFRRLNKRLKEQVEERRQAEEALKASEQALAISEENWRSFAGLTSDYVHKCTRTGTAPFRIQWMGGGVGSISGYRAEEINERGCWLPLVHPDDRERIAADLFSLVPGDVKQLDYRLVTKQGETRWISEKCRCLAGETEGELILFGAASDVTEHKQLEQQMLHAQKLESLGILAGGIAHDFNNILMAITGNAELALRRIDKESPAVDNLHRIEQSAARAADLAGQMLAYSGRGKFVVENIDLNTLLDEMLHMLEVSISKKTELRFTPFHPLPPVEADATQLRQIIMNLVINASEAIGDESGVITITTGCMACDRNYLKDVWLNENLEGGLYVYLEISDSGCGMDGETISKLFDPFFTTKFTGRGLGMAAVLGIVRGHKGAIKVYSEPGKGTTFKVLLPATGRPADLSSGDNDAEPYQGSGTVLLVDDEETVRGVGAELLEELGFTVITAADGMEAVEAFRFTPEIAFVILDLTMPRMDGEQCFRELRRIKPDVKVIMSSGYNEQEVTQKFTGAGLAGFIQKPYRLSILKKAVKCLERVGK